MRTSQKRKQGNNMALSGEVGPFAAVPRSIQGAVFDLIYERNADRPPEELAALFHDAMRAFAEHPLADRALADIAEREAALLGRMSLAEPLEEASQITDTFDPRELE